MDIEKALNWIERESKKTTQLLVSWASINSWSGNMEGLKQMENTLKQAFSPLADETRSIPLDPWSRMDQHGKIYSTPIGNALSFVKRQEAPFQMLLGGHMDTVFPPDAPFQVSRPSNDILMGPGVADMKGGLLVLWLALASFERYRGALEMGWRVFINPDEEIGSPSSCKEWEKQAAGADLGLLFEPAYPDGAFVDVRKGSYTASVFVKGTAAHAGRDFEKGKSAVKALTSWMEEAYRLASHYPDASLNIAGLSSSSLINIIPEEAKCVYNLRSFKAEDIKRFKKDLEKTSSKIEKREGVSITTYPEGGKPPKPWTSKTATLFEQVKECGLKLNTPFASRPSGGLSDGNLLAGFHIPCIDTLGVVGGGLHTSEEYMVVKSLGERAKLTCLLLFEYAKRQKI
jgi:glutamate carboxypeptidase